MGLRRAFAFRGSDARCKFDNVRVCLHFLDDGITRDRRGFVAAPTWAKGVLRSPSFSFTCTRLHFRVGPALRNADILETFQVWTITSVASA